MDAATLETIAKPVIKMVWEQVVHPELLKLEGKIAQADLVIICAALDAALNTVVEKELA